MALFKRRKSSIDLSQKKHTFSVLSFLTRSVGVLSILIFLVMLFFVYYYYHKYTLLRSVVSETSPRTESNPALSVIALVDKHMLLPGGEQPIIAKVTNLKQLAPFSFFKNAMEGDDVLVYCAAELSILYSPVRDKIIEVEQQVITGAACPQRGR
jgi:hypothetical protein